MLRLGMRGDHARPLLIEFKSRQTKALVMEFVGRLRGVQGKFKGVSLTHDMTQAEREQCKEAVAEAKAKAAADTSGECPVVPLRQPLP